MKHLHVACAIIERDGLILAGRRKPGLNMAGKWEFPGGKIDGGETAESALVRELGEELAVEIEIMRALPAHTHDYPGFTVTLYPFICRIVSGPAEIESTDHDALGWLPPGRLHELDWADADLPIIRGLAELKR